jgi:hypothetical protein
MKKLLLIWIFSGSLDGIGQNKIDTLPRYCNTAGVTLITYRTDTLRSILLVTGKPPAFTHAVYGYCVVRNGVHVGHLDSRGRLFKLPVRVWGCDNYQNRKR